MILRFVPWHALDPKSSCVQTSCAQNLMCPQFQYPKFVCHESHPVNGIDMHAATQWYTKDLAFSLPPFY